MKKYLPIILITIIAAVLRLYRIWDFPALNADEASIGYNAYSLLMTGLDEHGSSWPIHFQSFNDYKPGFIFYLVMPAIKLFGLGVWQVRIIPTILSVSAIPAIYLLVGELNNSFRLKVSAAFLLAISPWHIHFSRGAWEVSVALTFTIFASWLLIKGLKEGKSRQIILSSILFVLSLYTYHAARIISPLLVIAISVIYRKQSLKNIRKLVKAGIISGIIIAPLVFDFFGSAGLSRVAGVGLFADTGPLSRINEQRGEHNDFMSMSTKIVHNKPVNYGLAFLENWGEHYWGEFLFLSGDDIERNKVPETGQLHIFEIVFVAVGLLAIIRNHEKWRFVLFWLAIAPIPAALTFQSPHSLRALSMVIPITIISAYGLVEVIKFLQKNKKLSTLGLSMLAIIITLGFARYVHMYWGHLIQEYKFSSQYGLEKLTYIILDNQDEYEKVIVTDRYDQPYILFLFYSKYSPEKFQNNHELTPRDQFGFSTVRVFDKYDFRSIKYDEDRPNHPNSLIVGTDEEIPEEANIIETVREYGHTYFEVVAN